MNIASVIMLFFVSSWIIIHLGIKPESGGRPPNDSIVIKISEVINGSLFHMRDNDSVVVDELNENSMNVPKVIVM